MMAITCVYEDDQERCYINDAPSNEDCENLAKHLEKQWSAKVREDYNVGSDARYEIELNGFLFELRHHSSLGNYLTSRNGQVSVELKNVILDLNKRLA